MSIQAAERLPARRRISLAFLRAAVLRVRMALGYVPNVEWLRAQLSRAIALDRARAQAAIAETERCLRLRAKGNHCGRFAAPLH